MRILGVDFGTKRCGIAISNELAIFAIEVGVWARKDFLEELKKYQEKFEIDKIVIGFPLNMSGGETEVSELVRQFGAEVSEKTKLPVEFVDERLSTSMARGFTGEKRAHEDALAAQILLQNYLDKQNV
jgi:putative Holliday junction resolvase